jgi:hypothetical protein
MSLINDALKKAARQRAQEQADLAVPMPGGGARPRQGSPSRTQNMVLVGGGAIALVVVSAVLTGIFVSGRSEPKAAVPLSQPAAPRAQAAPEVPTAAVRVPQISVANPPAARTPVPVAETPRAQAPAPTLAPVVIAPPTATPKPPEQVAIRVPESATPAAAAATQAATQAAAPTHAPVAAPAATPVPTQSLGDRVQAVIDRIQISGVRYAGAESKAIIDGHIYRVNDVLDKVLGIRLSKFDPDHLTFVDSAGATYTKSF